LETDIIIFSLNYLKRLCKYLLIDSVTFFKGVYVKVEAYSDWIKENAEYKEDAPSGSDKTATVNLVSKL
jgi:hypothetical protein